MIDVHMLVMPGEREDWRDQCLASLKGEPVKVRVLDGWVDDLGGARAAAFLEGDEPFVSWVDPDDYVLPGGFQACVDAMERDNSDAACTQEYVTGISGKVTEGSPVKDWVHHLIVLRRSIVMQYLYEFQNWLHRTASFSEGRYFIEALIAKGCLVSYVRKPYYVWRRHYKADSVRRRRYG